MGSGVFVVFMSNGVYEMWWLYCFTPMLKYNQYVWKKIWIKYLPPVYTICTKSTESVVKNLEPFFHDIQLQGIEGASIPCADVHLLCSAVRFTQTVWGLNQQRTHYSYFSDACTRLYILWLKKKFPLCSRKIWIISATHSKDEYIFDLEPTLCEWN